MESCSTQAVLSLAELAADKVIRDRYNTPELDRPLLSLPAPRSTATQPSAASYANSPNAKRPIMPPLAFTDRLGYFPDPAAGTHESELNSKSIVFFPGLTSSTSSDSK
ncbi:MAG: hypothetical protein ACQESR_22295, partial [Planctomycetota bacterium]